MTFRTEAAEESIRRMKKAFPQMLIGAGTIVSADQAKRARNAGAEFLVSPGFSRSVTEYAQKEGIPILPGVCTPTEIMAAMDSGIETVKFFPAGQYGGLAAIKALSAPFPSIRFMPTGGIDQNNIREYLAFEKVIACGGSWMVKESLISRKRFKEIETLALEAVRYVAG